MREELFLANLAPDAFISAVHRAGTINTEFGPVTVDAALFDTGAISASYISQTFFRTHRAELAPYVREVRGWVKLAAKQSVVSITNSLILSVTFMDTKGKPHTA